MQEPQLEAVRALLSNMASRAVALASGPPRTAGRLGLSNAHLKNIGNTANNLASRLESLQPTIRRIRQQLQRERDEMNGGRPYPLKEWLEVTDGEAALLNSGTAAQAQADSSDSCQFLADPNTATFLQACTRAH